VRMTKDGFAVVASCDEGIEAALGWRADQLVGRRTLDFVHPDDRDPSVVGWVSMLERPGHVQVSRYRHRHADGSWVLVEATNRNTLEDDGFVTCELVVLERAADLADVGRRADAVDGVDAVDVMAVARTIRSGERLLRRLAEGLPTGVAHVDAHGVVTYANARCRELLGTSGATVDDLVHGLDAPGAALARRGLELVVGTDDEIAITVTTASADRPQRSLRVDLRGLAADAEGPAGVVVCVEDITDQVYAAAELERRASTDALTGCLNRAAVLELLDAELAAGDGLIVVFVDVDAMKRQNDLLGHAGGDALLVETTARLRGALRPDDAIGRIGGDEFLAVCPRVADRDAASVLVARVAKALRWTFEAGPFRFPVSASVGAVHLVSRVSVSEAVARADAAMYACKRGGTGGVSLWGETLDPPGEPAGHPH